MAVRAKYVIINDVDQPCPWLVAQWVPGVGYCYLERKGTMPSHDGMQSTEATSLEAFGLVWTENPDGTVSFYRSDRPLTATYRDGEPRPWQSSEASFEYRRLEPGAVRAGRSAVHA